MISEELREMYVHQSWCEFGMESRPGKPTDNPFIESFNGSFRDECLNLNWFFPLDDAQQKIEAWRVGDNEAEIGAPGEIRTSDRLVRSLISYGNLLKNNS